MVAARVRAKFESVPANLRGIFLIIVSGGCYAAMATLIRIVSSELHTFEIVFFRNLFAFLVVLPFFLRLGLHGMRTTKLPTYFARSAGQVAAQTAFFFGISLTALAVAVTLSMAQGIFVAIGAIIILAEPSVVGRWIAIGLGLFGVIVMMRPSVEGIDTGALLVVLSSMGYAAVQLNTKVLTRTERVPSVMAWTLIISVPVSFGIALFVWTWPTADQLFWLFMIGLFGAAGNATATLGFKIGEMTAVAPMMYVRLIWAALFGLLIFGETPDVFTLIGSVMIVAAGIYLSQGERHRARDKI
jgi:drug/metabolite transporter (DMT)-like permease